ncbi:MAG: 50S ribosomal protein L6 [Candidatus Yanofskybacteria bacterium]|nr:50S ribosomal protein L6 [Candidatus Yanofskybacteria bacterium]
MSRIGKKFILLPKGVELKVQDGFIISKGPNGELKKKLDPRITVQVQAEEVFVRPKEGAAEEVDSLWGLYRSLISNMVKGVSAPFEKILTFQGVGFRAAVKGSDLELHLGFTNPVTIKGPDGISFKVEKNKIIVSGIDKETVGQVAADIRKQRKPEPYQGSGIKYEKEVIVRKAGKKAATAAA